MQQYTHCVVYIYIYAALFTSYENIDIWNNTRIYNLARLVLCSTFHLCLTVKHVMMGPKAPTNTPMMPTVTPVTIPIMRGTTTLNTHTHSKEYITIHNPPG